MKRRRLAVPAGKLSAPARPRPETPWRVLCVVAALLYFAFFTYASAFYYRNLLYKDYDLAIHAQTLWNLSRGSGYCSLLGVHFFGNHFIPVFYLLTWAYRIAGSPLALLALQSFALASGVVLGYRVARRFVGPGWSALVALSYFFFPGVGGANLYEFHQTTLAVPFFFLMILAYLEDRFLLFLVWSAVVMAFQENLALAVLFFAVTARLDRKGWRWSAAPAVLAAAWLVVAFALVKPKLNQAGIDFFQVYDHLGGNAAEVLLSPFTRPGVWISTLASFRTLTYLFKVFAPFLCLPFLGWRYALPMLPFLLQHAMSQRVAEQDYAYHYYVELAPFLVTAAAAGLAAVFRRLSDPILRRASSLAFAVSFVISTMLASPFTRALDVMEKFADTDAVRASRSLIARVPPGASVVSGLHFAASLAHRQRLYAFHNVYLGTAILSSRAYPVPDDIEYALLDMRDAMTFGFESRPRDENLLRLLAGRAWVALDSVGDTVLLRRGDRAEMDALYRVNGPPEVPKIALNARSANGEIGLEGVTFDLGSGAAHAGQLRLTFHWKCLKKTARKYESAVTFVDGRGQTVHSLYRVIGYRIHPTYLWKEGDTVREHYWLVLPDDLPWEPLELRVGLVDRENPEKVLFVTDLPDRIDPQGRILVETIDPTPG